MLTLCHLLASLGLLPPASELGQLPLEDLGNLTATALLGWYAWYTASRSIPALVADFRNCLQADRELARQERDYFHQELAEERLQSHADHQAIVSALHELTAILRHPAPRTPRRAAAPKNPHAPQDPT